MVDSMSLMTWSNEIHNKLADFLQTLIHGGSKKGSCASFTIQGHTQHTSTSKRFATCMSFEVCDAVVKESSLLAMLFAHQTQLNLIYKSFGILTNHPMAELSVYHDQSLKTLLIAPITGSKHMLTSDGQKFPPLLKFGELHNFYILFIVYDMQITLQSGAVCPCCVINLKSMIISYKEMTHNNKYCI